MKKMINNKDLLIVDDDVFFAKNMAAFLSTHGYKVEYKHNGKEALETFRVSHNPVVLLDIFMPGISGLDVLNEISVINPKTQVIMISGQDDNETVEAAMKNGAYDFIGKPVILEILIRRVHMAYLEYLSKVLNLDLEEQVNKHFEQVNHNKDITSPADRIDNETYLKTADIEINRELSRIIGQLNIKFLQKS
ncbi:MAG: hypothetical protein DKM50_13135 [Candidatus Margulisiibacteriota bacterium]|nr:MAG: hypothetical protein A2X43_13820 [Candidatus Margulisbacteria bacterium GWD2_39_127]OGI05545.1 MAG: hypothetical protein A2X42_00630 [Candidatus Margulisbacteria bacterium GWF2_38_17]OGI08374.1 MAG: hypothetical protein A2X41_10710 [Candidatus Margulisbacteria bacterium GWE2_39_32]PZM77345.1 MAG: hypothetical protein DKM50_13135 [Candidatus Margulisiibacteriota bacterium]HAR63145.1 hypothetical protein [Candidatus Margulisiibacteriota bacterium]